MIGRMNPLILQIFLVAGVYMYKLSFIFELRSVLIIARNLRSTRLYMITYSIF